LNGVFVVVQIFSSNDNPLATRSKFFFSPAFCQVRRTNVVARTNFVYNNDTRSRTFEGQVVVCH